MTETGVEGPALDSREWTEMLVDAGVTWLELCRSPARVLLAKAENRSVGVTGEESEPEPEPEVDEDTDVERVGTPDEDP